MAGKLGQGRIQTEIITELDRKPILCLRELDPDGSRSRRKALQRSAKKLLASGAITRLKVVVPTSSVPVIYDCVARVGTSVLGIPTVIRTEMDRPEPEPKEAGSEGKELVSLDERIAKCQERINS